MDIDHSAAQSISHLISDHPAQSTFSINPDQNTARNLHRTDSQNQALKRRPGRPKGSGKKASDSPHPLPKIKRPVGRPRKDGFPAGSVGSRRSTRPRRSVSARLSAPDNDLPGQSSFPFAAGNHQHQWQQWQSGQHSVYSAPPAGRQHHHPIDPNLDRDDWADLARNKPAAFLATLLSSLSAPNPVSSAGQSVEEAFKSHLVSLAPKADQAKGAQNIPGLYFILKTFWLPCSPTYFSLTASASSPRTPSEHRFLYWDPQPLVFNGIACPTCSAPLINKGRIRSGPVKVYDLENPFFIIGCEYVCKSGACVASTSLDGRKFASTDSAILRSLPTRLRDEFPAHLRHDDAGAAGSGPEVWNWQALGVSRSLWNMVRGCLKAGLGKTAILSVIRAIQGGVSDDDKRKEEEEDEDEWALLIPRKAQASGDAPTPPVTLDKKDHAVDDYSNNAWKTNSAVASAPPQAGPSTGTAAGPSTSVTTATTMSISQGSGTLTPPYGFQQPGPCIPYGYYTFFQQQQPQPQPSSGSNAHSTPTSNTPDPHLNNNSGGGSALKRPFTFAGDRVVGGSGSGNATTTTTTDVVILEPSQKRTRHCCKCGSQECKGKGGRSFCVNACQDCGKLDCKGRNSRRPDKRCDEAWS